MDKIESTTPNVTEENVERLLELFPQVVTEIESENGEIERAVDFDVLRDLLGDIAEGSRERYRFSWPGKFDAKAEARRPISKVFRPNKEESVSWNTTKNLYIEGDNLDALKILREAYAGKIKMIYIDPPYNTGHDFVYQDAFALDRNAYDELNGEYDFDGGRLVSNPESNGRFHSDWCSMIYPRLLLAKDLLTPDGLIFISIDDNEDANLRKICDEIFGASNFLNQIAWVSNITGRQISGRGAAKTWESVFIYARDAAQADSLYVDITHAKATMPDVYKGFNKEILEDEHGQFTVGDTLYNHNRKFNEETRPNLVFSIFYNPETEEIVPGEIGETKEGFVEVLPHANGDGTHKYHAWRWSRQKIINESYDLIVLPNSRGGYEIYTRIRDFDKTLLKDCITNISNGDAEVQKLFQGKRYFDYPKSTALLETLIGSCVQDGDTVLDFFSGSGTTAHALMNYCLRKHIDCKWILVQLPEVLHDKDEAYKAGFKTICDIARERIRLAGKAIANDSVDSLKLEYPTNQLDVGFRALTIDSSNMRDTHESPQETTQESLLGLIDNVKDGRTEDDLLFQILPKFRIPYSASVAELNINGKKVFDVEDGLLLACFDIDISTDVIEEIAKRKPSYVVMRDLSFKNDAAEANFEELFRTFSPDTIRRVI